MSRLTNQELALQFGEIYPGGHSNFRAADDTMINRIIGTRAEGARIWDVDGNEYIDYVGGLGPMILGYRHPDFISALKEHLDANSTMFGSGMVVTEYDIELGRKIRKYVPCAEKIKCCLSGSEAVQMAIRLARGYTGRPYFVRFQHHYHGWFDNVLGGVIDPQGSGMPHAVDSPETDLLMYTQGKAPGCLKESFLLPWNDMDALEKVVSQYGDQIAIMHFEGLVCNAFGLRPKPGFLEKAREICTAHGIVMSMDEVITGFRIGLGGAQAHIGVTPDLATFGKAMAGGLPFSMVAGRADILNLLADRTVLGPGTFNGWSLGVKAALTTIEILEKDNGRAYTDMENLQNKLADGLKAAAAHNDQRLIVSGFRGVFNTLFDLDTDDLFLEEDLMKLNMEKQFAFTKLLRDEGVLTTLARWHMSVGHTDKDIEDTITAADRALAKLTAAGM